MTQLQTKPGINGANTLSIPKDWDSTWFRKFLANSLKGADVRNAVGSGGITVSGNISSPYATIGFGAPVTLPGPVTITTSATAAPNLTVNQAFSTSQPSILIKALDGSGALVIDVQSATTGGFMSFKNSGVERGFIGTGPATLAGAALGDFAIGADTGILRIAGKGGTIVTAPVGAVSLTVNAVSGQRGIQVVGSGAAFAIAANGATVEQLYLDNTANGTGTAALRIDVSATTGAGTATFTATNKPTVTAGGPVTWLPISINGTVRYCPLWA